MKCTLKNIKLKFVLLLLLLIPVYSCKEDVTSNDSEALDVIEVEKRTDKEDVDIFIGSDLFENGEAERLNNLGIEFAKKEEFRKAEEKFIAAYRIEPNNPIVLNNLGNIYREIGTNKMALEYYSESFNASDSTYFLAGYNLGIAYCNEGEYEKSLDILEYIIDDTDDAYKKMLAEYVIVRVYISQNECAKAEKLYNKIKGDLDNYPQFKENRELLELKMKDCIQKR